GGQGPGDLEAVAVAAALVGGDGDAGGQIDFDSDGGHGIARSAPPSLKRCRFPTGILPEKLARRGRSKSLQNPWVRTLKRKTQRRSDDLDELWADFRRRGALKDEVTKAVIARRLTLLEAAARFDAVERESLSFDWDDFRLVNPGRTDAERRCHRV